MKLKYVFLPTLIAFASACSKEEPAEPAPDAITELSSPVAVEASGGNPAAETASKAITGDYMRDIIVEISDDSYEGRGPGSRGDVKARKYLAARMEELDLQPGAADGTWEQPFELVGINASQPGSWTFEGHDKSMTLQQWDDFIVGSGVQKDSVESGSPDASCAGPRCAPCPGAEAVFA